MFGSIYWKILIATLWIQVTPRGIPVFCCVVWLHIFATVFHCLPCWQVIWNKEKINLGPKHILEAITHSRYPEAASIMCQHNQSTQKENLSGSSFAFRYPTINLIPWWQGFFFFFYFITFPLSVPGFCMVITNSLSHNKEKFNDKFYFYYLGFFNWLA